MLRACRSEAEQRVLMCCLCARRCPGAPTTTTTAMSSSSYRWQTGPTWTPSGLDGEPLSWHCLFEPAHHSMYSVDATELWLLNVRAFLAFLLPTVSGHLGGRPHMGAQSALLEL